MFNMNMPRKFTDVIDGTSNSLAVGESVHAQLWGGGPGYGNATVGGPVSPWTNSGACSAPACPPTNRSYGRDFRNTRFPINSTVALLADSENDSPLGSMHTGGANFVYVDGHVSFVNTSINQTTLNQLASINGGEVTPSY
jgi:prepilin-type processing-associated H-X9-DG protein